MTTFISTGDAKTCPLQRDVDRMKMLLTEAYTQTHLDRWSLESVTPENASHSEYVLYNADADRTLYMLVNVDTNIVEDVWEF